MSTRAKALIVILAMLLVGLSAAPSQARFFAGFGFDPGFYRPYPVFYRPYLVPPPPPPAYVIERPVVYHSVYYGYSRPVVRHHRHIVAHRTCR